MSPGLCADSSIPYNMIKGGLQHPQISGIVALTNKEPVNLKIAITSKLLNSDLPVICRGETPQYEDNMASFGTDHIVDPFTIFADHMALALRKPSVFLLYNWLTGVPDNQIPDPIFPPDGTWILCGYGRFGKAMHARLSESGSTVSHHRRTTLKVLNALLTASSVGERKHAPYKRPGLNRQWDWSLGLRWMPTTSPLS